jgi:hypothetical protein
LENGFPDVISLDHDLGDKHYEDDYSDGKTGHDFAKWLIEYDMDTDTMPKDLKFTVHSKNPIGKQNIQQLLDKYIDYKEIK